MRVLLCIDDTDNMDSVGTGDLALQIAEEITNRCWGKGNTITRHQLFVHPDIPYTSHNSSMCLELQMEKDFIGHITNYACDFLARQSAEGSDPGLCILAPDLIKDKQSLIDFGQRAKHEVLTKEQAYQLAKGMGVHLSEHGGTGQGIIGALAGVGLRLSGNDGRFKGTIKIGAPGEIVKVEDIIKKTQIDLVKSLSGYKLKNSQLVRLGEKIKAVLLEDSCALLVDSINDDGQQGEIWQTCSKQQLRNF